MNAGRHSRVATEEQTNFKAASVRVRCWRCAGRGTGVSVFVALCLSLSLRGCVSMRRPRLRCVCLCLLVSVFFCLCLSLSLCVAVFLSLALSLVAKAVEEMQEVTRDCWVLHLYHFVREAVGADVC